jgi:hypothetical protein
MRLAIPDLPCTVRQITRFYPQILRTSPHFHLAAEAQPADEGIRTNLDRALRALGRPVSSTSAAVQYAAADTTKAVRMDAADTFYWVE